MAYAAGIEQFVATVNTALPPDYYKLPVERQRALYDSLAEVLPIPLPENFTWRDATGEHEGRPFRVRIDEPARRTGRGVVFYVRGGGFVIPVRYVPEPGMVHAPVRARRQRARRRHDPAVLRGGGAGRGREGAR